MGAPADERACALFAHLKELGFSCMLLSNNKEPRVKMFHDAVHVSYIYKAGKPNPASYRKAMEQMGTDVTNTVFVGDPDFYGCVRCKPCGIRTDLSEADPSERGDSDCSEEVFGKSSALFLSEKA